MSLHAENVRLMVEKLAEGVRTIGTKASVLMQKIPTKMEAMQIGDEVLSYADKMEEALSRLSTLVKLHVRVEEVGDGTWNLRLFMAVERGRSVSVNGNAN